MVMPIEYEVGNPRRDPEVLGQLLDSAWDNLDEGGDGLPVSPRFPSHLDTLQGATQEFLSVPVIRSDRIDHSSSKLKPEWLNILTLMFHHYFQYMRIDVAQETSPDPLVDALLLFCDCSDLASLHRTPGFSLMFSLLARYMGEELLSTNSSDDITLLFLSLRASWHNEKQIRLRRRTESLMPWSVASIKDGSLSTPITASEQACINPGLVLHAYKSDEKLLTFPDMLWLGASHDGHSRYSSITPYVSARWSPSFTAYDNAALWQAAMTFGVLEAITDLNIPEALLLEERSNGIVVFTCRNIGILVYHWIMRVFCSPDEGSDRRRHSFETLRRAIRALATECQSTGREIFEDLSQLPPNDVNDIACAIHLLLNAFYFPIARSYLHDLPQDVIVASNGLRRAVDILIQKMMASGWCPSLRHSYRLGNAQYWWYASSFKPFIRHSQNEHVDCSDTTCIVHSIDEATYKTVHVTPECSCIFLSPSIDSLGHILQSDGIPVIAYKDGALTVHPSAEGLPFVAISHVWVDGLGSSSEKGLPTCQIKRIHRYVKDLLGSTAIPAFWIDGICIPEERELRNKAIVMMRQTYEDAAKVLVFDSSIHTLCSSANSVEENVFRIVTSMWMQRVWTLQEALLAKELYFEFSTSIVSAADILLTLDQQASMNYGIGWMTTALTIRTSTPAHSVLDPTRTKNQPPFWEVMELLFHRSTSKPKDEPLAIAGLLNVDPDKMLSQSDLESRIRTLFVEIGTLPRDLIFGEFERMKTPGFRWCPTTLTSIGQLSPDSPDAVCTPDGLITKTEIEVLCLPQVRVMEDTRVYVNIPSIGAYYSLRDVMEDLPEDGSVSFNALIMRVEKPLHNRMGTSTPAVAVNLTEVEDGRDVHIVLDLPLLCEYVTLSRILSLGDKWDSVMKGHTMLEGRLVRTRVRVT